MNERIKQLAEQAGAVQYGVDYQRDAYPINLEELKKFAELIIGECMRMCEVAEWGCITHDQLLEAKGCITAQGYIAEHFGVENENQINK
jgi:hypothetical protein